MTTQVEKDFLRLIMMLHEIALPVIKAYFKNNVLGKEEYKGNLKTFLQNHKHDIYHLVHNVRCCQCGHPSVSNNNNNKMYGKQFDKFYSETNSKVKNHVQYGHGRKITQYCICGYMVVQTCSVGDMDISMVNAIIQTCVPGVDPSHSMWLNKIVEKRNELCHVDDLSRLTTDYTNATWEYIKGSVLGLAQSIPPDKSYMEGIESGIKLLKRVEFEKEEVKPVLDSMKKEVEKMTKSIESIAQQIAQMGTTINDVIKTVPQQIEKIEECIVQQCRIVSEENETRKTEIQNTVVDAKQEISEQIGAQAVITASTITEGCDMIQETIKEESKKHDEKLDTILQQVKKGTMQHRKKEVEFNVELSEEGQNVGKGTGDVVVTWSISEDKFTEKEKAEIIKNMHKVEQTAAVWLPYTFEYSGCGSIVIGTLLNKDVFLDIDKFGSSIRLFLDRFLDVSGIDCNLPFTINVKVVISEEPRKGTLNKEETDRLLAKYFDKIHQVVPEMLKETSEGVVKQWIELPLVYSLNLPPTVAENTNNILLISDKSDADITRQIIEMLPRDFIITQKKTLPDCLKDTIWLPRTGVSTRYRTSDDLNYSRSKFRCKGAYVVIADTHTKRTAIKVALELLQFTTCIALVPCDGFRYNDISTESIAIGKDLTWKKSLLEKMQLSYGLKYRRYLFVPPMLASGTRNINSISIVIMSSVLDQDKMNNIYFALKNHIGHNVYFELGEERQISLNEEEIKSQFGESNCILVLSDHSEFLSRILKMVDPIVCMVSFRKRFNDRDLLTSIEKKTTNLPCFTKVYNSEGTVWFYSLMRDRQLLHEVREQTLSNRKHHRKHFGGRLQVIVVLMSEDGVLDDALLNIVSKHYQEHTIKLFSADVPNKDVTDEKKRAFYDDLLSKIRHKAAIGRPWTQPWLMTDEGIFPRGYLPHHIQTEFLGQASQYGKKVIDDTSIDYSKSIMSKKKDDDKRIKWMKRRSNIDACLIDEESSLSSELSNSEEEKNKDNFKGSEQKKGKEYMREFVFQSEDI